MEQRRYACDSCRRRRVRCDALQPCSNCTRASLRCTYGSTTSRQSATSYARVLEQQVADLKCQLDALTGTALASSSIAPPYQQSPLDLLISPENNFVLRRPAGTKVYRYSAGLNLLRTMADLLSSGDVVPVPVDPPGRALFEVMESSVDLPNRTHLDLLAVLLPPKDTILTIATRAMDAALVCHECIDRARFREHIDQMFESSIAKPSLGHKSLMALTYVLLALGERYSPNYGNRSAGCSPTGGEIPGLQYFRASRYLIYDDHDPTDLYSITSMMLHARYLLTFSSFSDAHAALLPAISASMRMGMHLDDSLSQDTFTEDELYDRRRIFAVLNMMETYLAYHLGLPRTLCSASQRQTLGLSSEDLLDEGRSFILRHSTSLEAETILSQKLLRIHAKIHDHQFVAPQKAWEEVAWINGIESDLQTWESELPALPEDPPNSRVVLGQMILRLQCAGIQILFYAHYVPHLARDKDDPAFSADGYRYGSMCIRAATQAVLIIQTLHAHDILNEAHWMNRSILAWAATTLIYFVMHSRVRVTIEESKSAALVACKMLQTLGATNLAAKHIHDCIAPYMDVVSTAGTG